MTTAIFDLETTGLNSSEHRIICISSTIVGSNKMVSFYGIDESQMIEDFWNHIRTNDIRTLISFNGDGFDYPFLVKRSLIRRQKIVKNITLIDLRKVVNSFYTSYNKFEKGDAAFWAQTLGIPIQTTNGGTMPILFLEGKYEEIKKHCEEDVMVTEKLFDLCRYCELL
jgi:predicted PolB exonuclease-like 3'-5' exonuclease